MISKIAVLLIVMMSLNSVPQNPNGAISGRIFTMTNSNTLVAKVGVLNMDSTEVGTCYSDSIGTYRCKELIPGTYILKVSKPGYVDVFNKAIVKSDQVSFINFRIYTQEEIIEVGKCYYNMAQRRPACHKCTKKNDVIPYRYGLLVGDHSGDGIEYISGGCEITDCQAKWYCKRDKTDVLLPNNQFIQK